MVHARLDAYGDIGITPAYLRAFPSAPGRSASRFADAHPGYAACLPRILRRPMSGSVPPEWSSCIRPRTHLQRAADRRCCSRRSASCTPCLCPAHAGAADRRAGAVRVHSGALRSRRARRGAVVDRLGSGDLTFVTYALLHGDLNHLFFNAIWLLPSARRSRAGSARCVSACSASSLRRPAPPCTSPPISARRCR